jgi:hypothetical protein
MRLLGTTVRRREKTEQDKGAQLQYEVFKLKISREGDF